MPESFELRVAWLTERTDCFALLAMTENYPPTYTTAAFSRRLYPDDITSP